MKPLVECVPNFSEGRDASVIDAIVRAIQTVAGILLLDRTSDADHNRSVITMAGPPDAALEAALRAVGKAAELIDLRKHKGEHPRIGATDVLPFVPARDITLEECAALAHRAGREIWQRYKIPVFFYEAAALRPDRRNLERVRKGRFEGLLDDIQINPDRAPDIGDARLHPSAGAVAVGARKFLIAFNINLATSDLNVAREIAKTIRASSGGLPCVKALGIDLRAQGLTQVSMNLTDFEQTPMRRVFDMVKAEAGRHDVKIAGSELIGLVPRAALTDADVRHMQIENFSDTRVFENRVLQAENEMSA